MAIELLDFSAFKVNDRLKKIAEATAKDQLINFGWVLPENRTPQQDATNKRIVEAMPRFNVRGAGPIRERRYALWQAALKVLGKHISYALQSTGSCFPAGVPVLMADGSEKPIEDVVTGDEVVTHTGFNRRVVETMNRVYTGEMVTLHATGFAFPLTMTADHMVAVVTTEGRTLPRWPCDELKHNLSWVRADEVTEGDRVVIGWCREEQYHELDLLPLLGENGVDGDAITTDCGESHGPYSRAGAVRDDPRVKSGELAGRIWLYESRRKNAIFRRAAVTESFARLIGLYLAEGGVHAGRITFTFSAAERDTLAAETISLVRGIFGVDGELNHEPGRGRTTVRFNNATLAAVFKALIPGDVYSKRVPPLFFRSPLPVRAALIGGWFAGDGYYRSSDEKRCPRIQGVTASAGLARDITTLSLSVGYKTSCSRRRPRGRSREAWDVFLSGVDAHAAIAAAKGCVAATLYRQPKSDSARCPYGYARRVKKIERTTVERLPVFDFEVEEDHSFVAGGIVVHNCVGSNGGNLLMTTQCVEIALGELEQFKWLWWPFTYGKSRERGGMNGEGDGSFESVWFEAITEDGSFEHDPEGEPDLPDPVQRGSMLELPASVEKKWSNGRAIARNWSALAVRHLIKSASVIKSTDDAIAALTNGYCIGMASMFGWMPMVPKPVGNPPIRLVKQWNAQWPHKMWLDEYWDHPTEGEVFRVGNDWGDNAHGPPTGEEPPGGVYITIGLLDRIIKSRGSELIAYSKYDGFAARKLDFSAF